jgi:hypothetical protein
MAVAIIPLIPSEPYYNFDTVLDDVQFFFTVRWNSKDAAWYLDMYDADNALMFAGEKLVLGTYIGRKSAHPWFNVNVLACIDTTTSELDAGLDEMGFRVLLQHYPVVDLVKELLVP